MCGWNDEYLFVETFVFYTYTMHVLLIFVDECGVLFLLLFCFNLLSEFLFCLLVNLFANFKLIAIH